MSAIGTSRGRRLGDQASGGQRGQLLGGNIGGKSGAGGNVDGRPAAGHGRFHGHVPDDHHVIGHQ